MELARERVWQRLLSGNAPDTSETQLPGINGAANRSRWRIGIATAALLLVGLALIAENLRQERADATAAISGGAAPAALLQASQDRDAAGARTLFNFSGTVTNALSREGIAQATIKLTDSERGIVYTQISSEGGRFVFKDVRPGTYEIRLERSGFKDGDSRQTVVLQEGTEVHDIILKLTPRSKDDPAPADAVEQLIGEIRAFTGSRKQERLLTLPPPPSGRQIFDRACTVCHSAAIGWRKFSSIEEAQGLVSNEIARGAKVSEAEAPVLAEILFKYGGQYQ
jgi:hypothetical protein